MMALDLKTGKPLWDKALPIGEFGITRAQPIGGPLLFLSRRQKPNHSNNGLPPWSITVQIVDIRKGKIVHEAAGLPTRTTPQEVMTHVSIQPAESQYIVSVDRNRLAVTLRDEPPRPNRRPKRLPKQSRRMGPAFRDPSNHLVSFKESNNYSLRAIVGFIPCVVRVASGTLVGNNEVLSSTTFAGDRPAPLH
ncbi:MAG: hypothetical protein R3C05_25370 [Pirellulaceae bacterium]